jgi:hypothetical protein
METTITIGGRQFHGIIEAMTGRQDDFILTQLRRSGAMDVLAALPKDATDEQRNAASDEMFNRIVESGRKYKLLAGLLTEEGKKWTQASAEANAEQFAELTGTEDKVTMSGAVMRHVVLFFQFGAASSTTSPNSSSQNVAAPLTESAAVETSATSAQ